MNWLRLTLFVCLTTALPAAAFVVDVDGSNNPRSWRLLQPDTGISTNVVNRNTHAIRYFLASDGFSVTNTAAELNAIRASFDQWQSIPGTHLKFEDGGLIGPPSNINLNDSTNFVYWSRTATVNGSDNISGVLGFTYIRWNIPGNIVQQADIVFNGVSRTWFTDFMDPNGATTASIFVEAVALHEIGHFIGLNHSPMGGATMLFRGSAGVSIQAELSSDDVAAARYVYPLGATNYGLVQGTVTKSGNPVFGAAVFAETATSNVIAGTVTEANGVYKLQALPPGNYNIRVAPLDSSSAANRMVAGVDIATNYNSADINFLPSANTPVALAANTTNIVDFSVVNGAPAFNITAVRTASATSGSYAWSSLPKSLRAGQSNLYMGVLSSNLPTSGATLTITGDGLTVGPTLFTSNLGGSGAGLHFISALVSVSSNATPGSRDFIVTQGANVAYANGFFEVLPAVSDYNFDGLDDVFQRQFFPLFTGTSAAPTADPDGDGMNNYAESVADTIPTNAASLLAIQGVSRVNNTTTVGWQSVNGKKYQLSGTTNVAQGPWENLGSVVTAAGASASTTDTSTNGHRAYRVQVFP